MLIRALSLETVTLLIGCFATAPAWAQSTYLEAGKSPAQIFAGTCTACHKSPRGLLKSVPPGSLQSFLRQHYTTSPDMASLLTAFLISNGAADARAAGAQAKPGKEAKSEARTGPPSEQLDRFGHRLRPTAQEDGRPEAEPREPAKPDAEGRHGRTAKRLERPGEALGPEGQNPAQAAIEHGPDGHKLSAREKLSKRSKPGGEEPPKTDAAKTEAAKTEPGKEEHAKGEAAREEGPKGETAKIESGKQESAKLPGEDKSETAKSEAPKEPGNGETPTLRADPVPPVTPAPTASPTVSAAVSGATPEPASMPVVPPPVPPAPAVTAAAPAPVAPAGPPAPPISQ
jgi:hypothetical protein